MTHLSQNKPKYFEIQYKNSKASIVPFVKDFVDFKEGTRVMEIGSAEGGVLKAFVELNCKCLGVELSEGRTKLAKEFQDDAVKSGKIKFFAKDIYDFEADEAEGKFDLIILKDVIEHIHGQEKFMAEVGKFLKDDGKIFFGFPSWRMPYGGHQQVCKSKIGSKLPYYHILPRFMYKGMLKMFGESNDKIESLLEIKDTRISTARFERLCKVNNYSILKRTKYFVAPIYEYKFGYKTKKLWSWLGAIPWLNDFFTFQSYYIIEKSEK